MVYGKGNIPDAIKTTCKQSKVERQKAVRQKNYRISEKIYFQGSIYWIPSHYLWLGIISENLPIASFDRCSKWMEVIADHCKT